MKRRGLRRLLPLLLVTLLLTGCWDLRDIEEVASVLAVGYDPCPADDDCRIRLTQQIAIPGRIPLGPGQSGSTAETVSISIGMGRSYAESIAEAQSRLNRPIDFGHMRIFIINEEVARAGLGDDFDFIRRLAETRRTKYVAISEGPAEALVEARPALGRLPALFLSDMIDEAAGAGNLPRITEIRLDTDLLTPGQDPVAPLLRMASPDSPELAGLAVFKGTHMVDKLSMEEVSVLMTLLDARRAKTPLRVSLPNEGSATVQVYGRSAHYQLSWDGERITARIRLELESTLQLLSAGYSSSDPKVLQLIEDEAAEHVKRTSLALLERLQAYPADSIGLGERVRSRFPALWDQTPEWRDLFANARFQVEAKVDLRYTGLVLD